MSDDRELSLAIKRVNEAATAMRSGNPEPYIDCWTDSPDATLFGAWGPMEHGAKAVTDTFQWVARRFTGGHADIEQTVVAQSGDLAYTVGFERGPASVAGGPSKEMIIRVTHIYKRDGTDWKLVHRHADFPPPDQRKPSQLTNNDR
jgi:ketosteroid isomerase-like protein